MANTPYNAPAAQLADTDEQEPDRHRLLKKTLMIVGALFLAGVLILAITFGVLFYKGSKLDRYSKQYADTAVVAIVSDWNSAELERRMSPEFKAIVKEGDTSRLFGMLSRLGKLKEYRGSQGQSNMSVTTQQGKVISASYLCKAEFETGPAEIQLALIQHDGEWQILGFHVNSNVFADPSPKK